uniref:Uncharacterized protein n=1 Tax=Romanomermis culicivorax TaxID=13658 RepID=A0A915IKT0_ROMCU
MYHQKRAMELEIKDIEPYRCKQGLENWQSFVYTSAGQANSRRTLRENLSRDTLSKEIEDNGFKDLFCMECCKILDEIKVSVVTQKKMQNNETEKKEQRDGEMKQEIRLDGKK